MQTGGPLFCVSWLETRDPCDPTVQQDEWRRNMNSLCQSHKPGMEAGGNRRSRVNNGDFVQNCVEMGIQIQIGFDQWKNIEPQTGVR